MEYKEIKSCTALEPFIHSFWELKGDDNDGHWERNFPDGCPGLVLMQEVHVLPTMVQ